VKNEKTAEKREKSEKLPGILNKRAPMYIDISGETM
jgi:hypothetical protein